VQKESRILSSADNRPLPWAQNTKEDAEGGLGAWTTKRGLQGSHGKKDGFKKKRQGSVERVRKRAFKSGPGERLSHTSPGRRRNTRGGVGRHNPQITKGKDYEPNATGGKKNRGRGPTKIERGGGWCWPHGQRLGMV